MALTRVRETICGHTTLNALRLAWCHRLSRVGPGWYWRESWALSPRVFGKRRPGALQMGPWSVSFSLCSVLSLKSIEMWMRISCFFLVGFSSHFTQKANSYFDCVGVCAHTFPPPQWKDQKPSSCETKTRKHGSISAPGGVRYWLCSKQVKRK